MQVQGKYLVIATFAIALALAGGAWWHHYRQSRLAAEFWGRDAGSLLVSEGAAIHFIRLGEPVADNTDLVAGRPIAEEVDITDKPGMVHLRHALTYDENFVWDEQTAEPLNGDSDWAFALEFTRNGRRIVVLFTHDFTRLGKLASAAQGVAVLPCPKLGPVIVKYLGEVGVELAEASR